MEEVLPSHHPWSVAAAKLMNNAIVNQVFEPCWPRWPRIFFTSGDYNKVYERVEDELQAAISVSDEDDDGAADVKDNGEVKWLMATAAPHHATGNRALLSGYKPMPVRGRGEPRLQTGDGTPMPVRGRGAVANGAVTLRDVCYVPGLAANLVSVGQLADLGYTVGFGRGGMPIVDGEAAVAGVARVGEDGLFTLEFLNLPLEAV